MGSVVNERARNIYKANMGAIFLTSMIYALLNSAVSGVEDSMDLFLLSVLTSVATSLISASSSCYFFRAYNRGVPDRQDCMNIFGSYGDISKLLAIALVNTMINFAFALLAQLFIDTLLLGFIISIVSSFVSMLFAAVWFLYIANPDYNTADYFKASAKYIGENFFGYIGFTLGHFMVILGAIVLGMLLTVIGLLLAVVFVLVYMPYLELAIAGYVSRLIPDEWYEGTAQF